ncbi:MAG: hypothetical protein HLUCCA01_00280 [Bacteroidetes bacterium HLUCCA01]|nr:MAG: hypothetical protein HLUCCA01_00280 [Bacteroidetes bacterium HLUCCA01]
MSRLTQTIAFFILIFAFTTSLGAQNRYSYQMLVGQQRDGGVFLDVIHMPGSEPGNTRVIILHRLNHSYLTFRRQVIQNPENIQTRFTSDVSITYDFYNSSSDPVPREPYLYRETWSGSVTVTDFSETTDEDRYLAGVTVLEIPADTYRLLPVIQINGREVTGARAEALRGGRAATQMAPLRGRRAAREAREAEQRRGIMEVPDLSTDAFARMTLLGAANDTLTVRNHGRNVNFGEDFDLLISYPSAMQADSLELRVFNTGNRASSETGQSSQIYSAFIDPSYQLYHGSPQFISDSSLIKLDFAEDTRLKHHRITVPNHRFANAWYHAEVYSWHDGTAEKVGERSWQSRWFDMPVSLLNLDVAIDMMRFIVDPDELRQVRRSNLEEKETWFREFWSTRNPTPETEYNELMAEYYRRIDYAFENFSTPTTVGFESDQGRVYIVYGPPEDVDRRLPAGGTTTEVWTYPEQQFIFTATSGFGDFQLVQPTQ